MIRDLLAGPLLAAELVRDLDLRSLRKEHTAFVGDQRRQRFADMVWSAGYRKSAGRPPWGRLFLILEFQSGTD